MQKQAIQTRLPPVRPGDSLVKVDVFTAIGEVAAFGFGVWGVAMRYRIAAIGFVVAIGALSMASQAQAQTAPSAPQLSQPTASDQSAQTRRRPRVRVRIYREDERGVYPSYFPGPNAVRDCTATYVKEYRPSGTVIVPRMNCFWRPG
jgi:hypothetical protein